MAKTIKVNYENIGDVEFYTSPRARRFCVTADAYKPVKVSYPESESFTAAKAFFDNNIDRIDKMVAKIRLKESFGAKTYKDYHRVDIDAEAYKLYGRLSDLAIEYGYKFNRATIRNQRTVWGSCTSRNNISLNVNLIFLPRHLQDYVLLHELAHTKIKNHSKAFWDELDRTTAGLAKKLRAELTKYPTAGEYFRHR